jgi:hypothetical protein
MRFTFESLPFPMRASLEDDLGDIVRQFTEETLPSYLTVPTSLGESGNASYYPLEEVDSVQSGGSKATKPNKKPPRNIPDEDLSALYDPNSMIPPNGMEDVRIDSLASHLIVLPFHSPAANFLQDPNFAGMNSAPNSAPNACPSTASDCSDQPLSDSALELDVETAIPLESRFQCMSHMNSQEVQHMSFVGDVEGTGDFGAIPSSYFSDETMGQEVWESFDAGDEFMGLFDDDAENSKEFDSILSSIGPLDFDNIFWS